VVLARGYLQVGIGDPKLSILSAWKMQYALTLTVVPFEFHLPPIVILGWDGHWDHSANSIIQRLSSYAAATPRR